MAEKPTKEQRKVEMWRKTLADGYTPGLATGVLKMPVTTVCWKYWIVCGRDTFTDTTLYTPTATRSPLFI